MEKLLEFIVKNIVEDESAVVVTSAVDGDATVFTVKVAESDMGKVIGKDGRVAQAIRTVVKSMSGKNGFATAKYVVKIG
ncbi:MAG: KH domain-containing protein [Firmicutes bacterium]|nr:KH domain-containing protein [Bacillota bacterium]